MSTANIIVNADAKQRGLPASYSRKTAFSMGLGDTSEALLRAANTRGFSTSKLPRSPAVAASVVTDARGALAAYHRPLPRFANVHWNQQSDQAEPSVARETVPRGQAGTLSRRHSSVTANLPGAITPGGVGVDIKHNSYARYLTRLKGGQIDMAAPQHRVKLLQCRCDPAPAVTVD